MNKEEKAAMLAIIEKLMNELWSDYKLNHLNWMDQITSCTIHLNYEYPEVLWHWEQGNIVVTGYEQKEI